MIAFPHDPSLPQLVGLADQAVVARALRPHLTPLRVESCRLTRVRYRRGRRCVLHFAVEVSDGKRRWTQPVTLNAYASPDRASRTLRKLPENDSRRAARARLGFEPAWLLEELDALVQAFPFDRRLPALALLLSGNPGLRVVQYRPGLGAVLRTAGGSYVKVYREDAWPRPAPPASRVLLQPLEVLDSARAVVLPAAPGTSLRGDPRPGRIRVVARRLAELHDSDFTLPRHGAPARAAELERAAALVGWAAPETAADASALVDELAPWLDDTDPRPTHRDLKPDHVFVDGSEVTFIDVDSLASADPVLDVALLVSRLDDRAAALFEQEYFHRVPRAWRDRFHAQLAGALLEAAASAFRRQQPSWRERVPALVHDAIRVSLSGRYAAVPAGNILSTNPIRLGQRRAETGGLPS